MILPLWLSSSSNSDLETDIANGVEEFRPCASMQPTSSRQTPSFSLAAAQLEVVVLDDRVAWANRRCGPSPKLRLYFGVVGKGEKELQGPSNADIDEEPSRTSYTMKSSTSSTVTTKSPRGYGHGRHNYWLRRWERSEEMGDCHAYDSWCGD